MIKSNKGLIILWCFLVVSLPAKSEIWHCHFSEKEHSSSYRKTEIDVKVDLREESNKSNKDIVELILSSNTEKITIAKGYNYPFQYSYRKYWNKNKPPIMYNNIEKELFTPISNYDHHKSPGILEGVIYSDEVPTIFTLVRKKDSKNSIAIINVPVVSNSIEGKCSKVLHI